MRPGTNRAIPPCAASMGCLCAGHARGNPASVPCDTSEGPPAPKMVELLDELLAMAQDVGRTANNIARAEHAHAGAPRGRTSETYEKLRRARKEATRAAEALARARLRFLARFQ